MKDLSQIIHDDFYRRLGADRQVQHIIRSGGDLVEVSKLAGMIGQHLVRAVQSNLAGAELPFGTEEMTQIAREILDPMLRDNCKLLDRVFDEVQQRLDEAQGTALGTVHTGFPTVRAEQIYASAADPAAPPETILRRLSIPPETLINSHLDRTMQANARLRSSAGFETFIERTDDGKCCEWCSKMAGRYEYPDKTPKDVFRRHDNCGCRVVWVSGNMRQDVHSKATWEQPDVTEPELTKNPDVKVPELTRGLLTEGKKSSIMLLEDGSKFALPPITEKVTKLGYFENDDLDNAVTDAAKKLLSTAKEHALGTELGYIINIDPPYTISAPIIGGEGEMAIYIPHSKKSSVTLHNHPSGGTFSGKDIDNFIKDANAKAMCVIGNNGKWYVLEKSSSFDWIDFCLKTLSISESDDYVQKILEEASVYGFNYYKS